MHAQDIINDSLLALGVVSSGETPTTAESTDAFNELNRMIDAWNAQRLMIYSVTSQTFSLIAGQQTYTFGTGGNFNAPRPARISAASIVTLNNPSQPLELPIAYLTMREWQHIPVKNVPSALPLRVWDDDGFPFRNLNYWPVPNVNLQTKLYCWVPLSEFADLNTTDYEFPPAYADAIHWNLALRLAPMFGVVQVNPVVPSLATSSIAAIKTLNAVAADEPLRCDPAYVSRGRGIYDWRTGGYIGGSR